MIENWLFNVAATATVHVRIADHRTVFFFFLFWGGMVNASFVGLKDQNGKTEHVFSNIIALAWTGMSSNQVNMRKTE